MPAGSQTHLCGTSQPAWLPQPQPLPGTSDQRPENWGLGAGGVPSLPRPHVARDGHHAEATLLEGHVLLYRSLKVFSYESACICPVPGLAAM